MNDKDSVVRSLIKSEKEQQETLMLNECFKGVEESGIICLMVNISDSKFYSIGNSLIGVKVLPNAIYPIFLSSNKIKFVMSKKDLELKYIDNLAVFEFNGKLDNHLFTFEWRLSSTRVEKGKVDSVLISPETCNDICAISDSDPYYIFMILKNQFGSRPIIRIMKCKYEFLERDLNQYRFDIFKKEIINAYYNLEPALYDSSSNNVLYTITRTQTRKPGHKDLSTDIGISPKLFDFISKEQIWESYGYLDYSHRDFSLCRGIDKIDVNEFGYRISELTTFYGDIVQNKIYSYNINDQYVSTKYVLGDITFATYDAYDFNDKIYNQLICKFVDLIKDQFVKLIINNGIYNSEWKIKVPKWVELDYKLSELNESDFILTDCKLKVLRIVPSSGIDLQFIIKIPDSKPSEDTEHDWSYDMVINYNMNVNMIQCQNNKHSYRRNISLNPKSIIIQKYIYNHRVMYMEDVIYPRDFTRDLRLITGGNRLRIRFTDDEAIYYIEDTETEFAIKNRFSGNPHYVEIVVDSDFYHVVLSTNKGNIKLIDFKSDYYNDKDENDDNRIIIRDFFNIPKVYKYVKDSE